MRAVNDPATLATIGSVIIGFGAAMLFFRIQRELHMGSQREVVWLPWADWLLVAATLVSLLLIIVPITLFADLRVAWSAAGASAIMVAGYVFGILAHYRIICDRRFVLWGELRTGPRTNPEPSERFFVLLSVVVAGSFFLVGLPV